MPGHGSSDDCAEVVSPELGKFHEENFRKLKFSRIIAEKRPSWWYYENVSSQSSNPFLLYQTEISCEASPSSPSRHLALAASFLFVLLNEVSETVGRNKSR